MDPTSAVRSTVRHPADTKTRPRIVGASLIIPRAQSFVQTCSGDGSWDQDACTVHSDPWIKAIDPDDHEVVPEIDEPSPVELLSPPPEDVTSWCAWRCCWSK